jgi:hypothetical protein
MLSPANRIKIQFKLSIELFFQEQTLYFGSGLNSISDEHQTLGLRLLLFRY